ncbi:unnamed protein product [Strongylus vulgaris]|uniref:Uncharacterized protein n=1 Tax=Strongylus vulgaris TaxID=40348 RepID=A0A3P7I594_STRVU|nr:unnamed protein product [Strongylus vulgaris]
MSGQPGPSATSPPAEASLAPTPSAVTSTTAAPAPAPPAPTPSAASPAAAPSAPLPPTPSAPPVAPAQAATANVQTTAVPETPIANGVAAAGPNGATQHANGGLPNNSLMNVVGRTSFIAKVSD